MGERDLPVFGTAQGGSGALIVTDGPVDWVVRPDPLLRVKDGYGMIVTGDSMDPVHKHGSTALVNPHIPWRSGDTCIFRSHHDNGDNIVIIKELRPVHGRHLVCPAVQSAQGFHAETVGMAGMPRHRRQFLQPLPDLRI
ncbi:S24 family peptidase [Bradyrhizobium lablabi]|uniref:S24 family peptidase n=1 Tax=Bradyrhizobium lablabi TaxID=722472 RepID=UPI0009454547